MLSGFQYSFAQKDINALNPSRDLKSAFEHLGYQRDSLTFLTMNRIFDTTYSEEERLGFVMLLSEIGTDTCIKFLFYNIDKRIYSGPINGDGDMAKTVIFNAALSKVQNKWKIISNIIDLLNTQIEERQFNRIALYFAHASGSNKIARLILENQYRGSKEPLRYNINKLLAIIPSQ